MKRNSVHLFSNTTKNLTKQYIEDFGFSKLNKNKTNSHEQDNINNDFQDIEDIEDIEDNEDLITEQDTYL